MGRGQSGPRICAALVVSGHPTKTGWDIVINKAKKERGGEKPCYSPTRNWSNKAQLSVHPGHAGELRADSPLVIRELAWRPPSA